MTRWSREHLAKLSASVQHRIADPLAPLRDPWQLKDRRRKYGNTKVTLDGIVFDSKLEAHRYGELKLLAAAKEITDLKIHEKIPLHAQGGEPVGYYVADFDYRDKSGQRVLEDTKGILTALYSWKRRHVKAELGITITEIRHHP